MNNDLMSALKAIIGDELAKFSENNPGKSPFIDGKEHSVDELARMAAGVFEGFMPEQEQECNDIVSADFTENVQDRDFNELIECVKKKYTAKPMVRFELEPKIDISVFDSKVGGIPYMPKGFDYPLGKSGIYEKRPLRFLAQLNFERLPHIIGFPEKGILQFFCSDDTEEYVYGMDHDNMFEQNGFRVIYHKDIVYDEAQLCNAEDIPEFDYDSTGFPVDGSFILKSSEPTECEITCYDFRCDEMIKDLCYEQCGHRPSNIRGIVDLGYDEEQVDSFYWSDTEDYSCIGGYPQFRQDDPRYNADYADCDVLLFQLSSYIGKEPYQILWGDAGIANFFISSEDLKNLDFSRVLYSWDCT